MESSLSRLEKSYLKQKSIFETSKEQKVKNLENQIEAVKAKISASEKVLENLTRTKAEIEKREFETLDSFRSRAEEAKKKSEETQTTQSS